MSGKGIMTAAAGIVSTLVAAHKVSAEVASLANWLPPIADAMAAIAVCGLCLWALRRPRTDPSRA
ncbi:MAG: hypothetical protein FJX59_17285 [Alphaproteobacteria bacterium]|nr:hypothetical protein [Alphaproteobacteria bacterium]